MERIAIISDIHGNIPALEAVLDDIKRKKIPRIFCLGDLAGKGPNPAEAVDTIRDHCEVVIKGNWDYYLTEQKREGVLSWHQNRLGAERLRYLKELPVYKEFYISGKLLRLCHASPNDLFHRVYLSTEQAERLQLFEATSTLDAEADVVGYGDIHGAHIDHFAGKTIFNVGSVGNPLDITQASYGIIEGALDDRNPASFSIALVRVPYDIELAIHQADLTDMPEKEDYINELKTGIYRGHKTIHRKEG
ncbi:putative phosphoesterase [Desulfosporosinus acidiphilus SJ4]|uniref:Putative phosphoesterase n=1 Tax=Desulfosporosinus acidiphilus (strain DSM 22704 / JCM 16185 / SJ4) TaxID=646529 RepID=I4D0P1_DESAJ|nr:metallophosphoesterase family protein [Desulfosporosinus acidiphilus]AFM39365.1 putative phosphoesterase [Desulfosporosinus acidiphilus SJ4]